MITLSLSVSRRRPFIVWLESKNTHSFISSSFFFFVPFLLSFLFLLSLFLCICTFLPVPVLPLSLTLNHHPRSTWREWVNSFFFPPLPHFLFQSYFHPIFCSHFLSLQNVSFTIKKILKSSVLVVIKNTWFWPIQDGGWKRRKRKKNYFTRGLWRKEVTKEQMSSYQVTWTGSRLTATFLSGKEKCCSYQGGWFAGL